MTVAGRKQVRGGRDEYPPECAFCGSLTNTERNALAFAASAAAAGTSVYLPSEAEATRWRAVAAHIYVRCAASLAEPFRICLRPAGHDGEHGMDPDA